MKKIISLLMWMFCLPALGAPVITNVLVTNMTTTTVTIQWTTSTPSSSQVMYGTDPSLPYSTNAVATPVTNHAVTLQLLVAGPFYYAAAVSADNSGSTQSSPVTWSMCGSPLTPVNGTATNYYAYGTYSMAWQPPAGFSQAPTVCGQSFPTTIAGNLDGGSSFNTNVADASKIVPGPGQWQVTVTDAGNIAPITISAYLSQVTQNISIPLQAAAKASGLQTCLTNTLTSDSWPPSCGSGGGGGGGCSQCAYLNVANTFSQTNTFPAITVNGGINGLPLYENTGLFNVSMGVGSIPRTATGSQNFGIADQTLSSLTSGFGNGGIGVGALNALTTGFEFICVGDECGANATTSYKSAGLGAGALFGLTTGDNDTGMGAGACSDIQASSGVVCVGYLAGSSNIGTYSSLPSGMFIGANTLPQANGDTNEEVIGNGATGHGSNTQTIGNSSMTSAVIYGVPTFPSLGGAGSGCIGISNTGLTSTVSCGSGGGGSYAFQVNGTPLISTATINFVNGSNVLITNPSAGNVSFAVTSFPYSGLTGTVPTWNQSTTGQAGTALALAATPTQCSSGSAPIGIAANGNVNGCQSISPATGPTLQTNGTNNTSGTLLNFVSTSTIAFTNPSGGIESAAIVSPGNSTLLGFNSGGTYTGFSLGTNLAFSGSVLNATGISGTLTANCIPKATGASSLACSSITDSGTLVSISEPVALTSTLPGVWDLAAGTGSLNAAPANSYGFIGPVTGGTSYDMQNPNAASSTGGLLEYAAPTTVNNRNVTTATWFHPEASLSSGVGTFGGNALYAVLANTVASNNGHWTNISISTLAANSGCATPPQMTVFAGNAYGNFATAPTSETYQNGSQANVAQTLAFTAGQQIGIVIEVAGSGCTTPQMTVTGQYSEP